MSVARLLQSYGNRFLPTLLQSQFAISVAPKISCLSPVVPKIFGIRLMHFTKPLGTGMLIQWLIYILTKLFLFSVVDLLSFWTTVFYWKWLQIRLDAVQIKRWVCHSNGTDMVLVAW